MSQLSALHIMDAAYAASLKIVRRHSGLIELAGHPPSPLSSGELIAASNLAIALFSFEAEAASMQPPEEDDQIAEG